MPTIADILKSKITKGGKSKTYVASELGVTEKTIENYMNGKREPDTSSLIKLAIILGFSLNDLSEQTVPKDAPEVKEDPELYNMVLPLGGLKVTLKDYVELLKEKSRMAEESKREAEKRERTLLALLENNLTEIKANSITIRDHLAQVGRMVRADDLTTMDSLDRIEGLEAGTSSTVASTLERGLGASDQDTDMSDSSDTVDNSGKVKQQGKA